MESTPLSEHGQQQPNETSSKNKEQCDKYCSLYRGKFRDVPYISSTQLVEMGQKGTNNNVVLVDVRTEPEQQVSMIEGAITKEEFHRQFATSSANTNTNEDEAPMIVTYCTIGYRSGLEAKRLQLQYPHLKDRIYSLDGVVSYTHALGSTLDQEKGENNANQEYQNSSNPSENGGLLHLVKPGTGQVTNKVHTFGGMWECVDDQNFEATHYSIPVLLLRLCQVLCAIVTYFCLRLGQLCGCLPVARRQQLPGPANQQ